jgi:hypothetical protein
MFGKSLYFLAAKPDDELAMVHRFGEETTIERGKRPLSSRV